MYYVCDILPVLWVGIIRWRPDLKGPESVVRGRIQCRWNPCGRECCSAFPQRFLLLDTEEALISWYSRLEAASPMTEMIRG